MCVLQENNGALKDWLMYHKVVYFQLIFPVALVLTLLGACFVGLFWRLASRFDARQCVAEWLDGFSPESYASGAIVAERRPRVSRIAGWLPP